MQTSYTDKGPKPDVGKFLGFDHVRFIVGNAAQAASYYTTRFGFEYFAYKGFTTGERNVVSHVVRKNNVRRGFFETSHPCPFSNERSPPTFFFFLFSSRPSFPPRRSFSSSLRR